MMVAVWSVALVALWSLFFRRVPPAVAFAYAVIVFLGVELVVLLVNPLVGLGLPWLEVVVWAVVTVLAVVAWVRGPRPVVTRRGVALGVAAASGGILVVGATALAQVIPGALRLAWAMNSDAVNVVAFSRELLAAGGIDPSASDTPTPLPFAMLASAASPGRGGVADAALAGHDIAALAALWVLMAAVCCVLAGAVVARSVERVRTPLAVAATAVGSLLGTTWFVLGVQFQFGFVTTAFAVALLLAGWLVYLDGARRPALALTALVVAVAALLGVWSPLVVVLVPLGVVVVVRHWRTIIRSGWRGLVPLGGAVVVVLVYLLGISLPLYLAASSFLAADGGFPAIGPSTIVAAVGAAGLAVALAARFRGERDALVGFIALSIGFGVGLAFLLAQRLGTEVMWGYYPAKFAWTVAILAIVIAVGAASSLLEGASGRRRTDVVAMGFGLVLLAGLVWSPSEPQDPVAQLPLVGILQGNAFDLTHEQADAVLEFSGRENGQDVLWRTPFDTWGNRWLLQLDVDDFNTNPVRSYAYLTSLNAGDVCSIAELLGDDVIVHTSDPAAADELAATCPSTDLEVRDF